MWVDPGSRGLGIGRLLLEGIIDWARDAGARHLVLGATCGDTPANRLYASAGFQPVGEAEPLRPESSLLAQTLRLAIA